MNLTQLSTRFVAFFLGNHHCNTNLHKGSPPPWLTHHEAFCCGHLPWFDCTKNQPLLIHTFAYTSFFPLQLLSPSHAMGLEDETFQQFTPCHMLDAYSCKPLLALLRCSLRHKRCVTHLALCRHDCVRQRSHSLRVRGGPCCFTLQLTKNGTQNASSCLGALLLRLLASNDNLVIAVCLSAESLFTPPPFESSGIGVGTSLMPSLS
jgi:hypothetical protein